MSVKSLELHAILLAILCLAGAGPAVGREIASESVDVPVDAPVKAAPPEGAVGGVGDVNLFPKRIVLDDRTRVATVGLYNRAAGTGEYEIGIADKLMLPSGEIVDLATVTDPAQRVRLKPAADMLRWSPRRVVLQGNEAQTVRVMARLPEGLPPGEYRAHFSAIAVPQGDEGGLSIEDASGQQPTNSIGVRIVPRFGISIPVIVRVGETTLTVGLRDLRAVTLADGRKGLALVITREGTRSAFGDIAVTVAGGKTPIAITRGVGVYPEIDAREVVLPLVSKTAPVVSGTRVTVTYTDDDFAPGKTLARQDFVVP